MEENFYITGCMGVNKKKLYLPDSSLVSDLNIKVEEGFSVDRHHQKLIWKGRILNNEGPSLEALKIKKGDVIMVLGKVLHAEEEKIIEILEKFKNLFREEEMNTAEILSAVDDLCLSDDRKQLLKKLKKKLVYSSELLMKLLEDIDAMEIMKLENVRSKRKSLVNDIQKLMDLIDKNYAKLNAVPEES